MATPSPTTSGGVGITGFFKNVLGGLVQPATDAAGFFLKDKVGLVQFEQENTDAGLLARLGFGQGAAQTPVNQPDNSNLLLWGGAAVVGLLAFSAFSGDG